jgi:hypothetical protein
MEKLQLRLPRLVHLLHQFRHTFRRAPTIKLAYHPRKLSSQAQLTKMTDTPLQHVHNNAQPAHSTFLSPPQSSAHLSSTLARKKH